MKRGTHYIPPFFPTSSLSFPFFLSGAVPLPRKGRSEWKKERAEALQRSADLCTDRVSTVLLAVGCFAVIVMCLLQCSLTKLVGAVSIVSCAEGSKRGKWGGPRSAL